MRSGGCRGGAIGEWHGFGHAIGGTHVGTGDGLNGLDQRSRHRGTGQHDEIHGCGASTGGINHPLGGGRRQPRSGGPGTGSGEGIKVQCPGGHVGRQAAGETQRRAHQGERSERGGERPHRELPQNGVPLGGECSMGVHHWFGRAGGPRGMHHRRHGVGQQIRQRDPGVCGSHRRARRLGHDHVAGTGGETDHPGQAGGAGGADRPLHSGSPHQASHGSQTDLGIHGHHHTASQPDAVGGDQTIGTGRHQQRHAVAGHEAVSHKLRGNAMGMGRQFLP